MSQQQMPTSRRRKKEYHEPKLSFDAGKVFDPAENKAYDLELDRDSARYKAQKGQGGNRRA